MSKHITAILIGSGILSIFAGWVYLATAYGGWIIAGPFLLIVAWMIGTAVIEALD